MADIFLGYHSADRAAAQRLAELLEHVGFTVWWEQSLPLGPDVDDEIPTQFLLATAVIVLWSAQSVHSQQLGWVAEIAIERAKYCPLRVEAFTPSRNFTSIEMTDFSDLMDPNFATSRKFVNLTAELLRLKKASISELLSAAEQWDESPRELEQAQRYRPQPYRPRRRKRVGGPPDPINVAVNAPRALGPTWQTIRAYLYPACDEMRVREDFQRVRPSDYFQHTSAETGISNIRTGTPVTVVIHLHQMLSAITRKSSLYGGNKGTKLSSRCVILVSLLPRYRRGM